MSNLVERIAELKKTRKAVILAHNYQNAEVQDIADFTGDSLGLSRMAAETDAEVIVFCGVHFMAETAAILSPKKIVLLPSENAGCPMANMITAQDLISLKKQHPKALVVCYVNSTAEVKAESDVCCTSANAVLVINSLPADQDIIFVPDKYLGSYAAEKSGRKLILWNGYCPTHMRLADFQIQRLREQYPKAEVLVHPEARTDVVKAADKALSTGQMLRYVKVADAKEFIIGTEIGIIHALQKDNPEKHFYPLSQDAVCPNMKLTDLTDVLFALENMQYVIAVPEEIRLRAFSAVQRMIEIT